MPPVNKNQPSGGLRTIQLLRTMPLLCRLTALYHCLQVLLTRRLDLFLYCTEDIRDQSNAMLLEKQVRLHYAFRALVVGLIAAVCLLFGAASLTPPPATLFDTGPDPVPRIVRIMPAGTRKKRALGREVKTAPVS